MFFFLIWIYVFFFFFQAEDGIRDDLVTGVQTCALLLPGPPDVALLVEARFELDVHEDLFALRGRADQGIDDRSEERRVGGKCSGSGVVRHLKKNIVVRRILLMVAR